VPFRADPFVCALTPIRSLSRFAFRKRLEDPADTLEDAEYEESGEDQPSESWTDRNQKHHAEEAREEPAGEPLSELLDLAVGQPNRSQDQTDAEAYTEQEF
jgi:hypothetical protein